MPEVDVQRCKLCKCEGAAKRCSACQEVWYCSRDHQKQDWKAHKEHCTGLLKNQKPKEELQEEAVTETDACLEAYRKAMHKKPISPSDYEGKGRASEVCFSPIGLSHNLQEFDWKTGTHHEQAQPDSGASMMRDVGRRGIQITNQEMAERVTAHRLARNNFRGSIGDSNQSRRVCELGRLACDLDAHALVLGWLPPSQLSQVDPSWQSTNLHYLSKKALRPSLRHQLSSYAVKLQASGSASKGHSGSNKRRDSFATRGGKLEAMAKLSLKKDLAKMMSAIDSRPDVETPQTARAPPTASSSQSRTPQQPLTARLASHGQSPRMQPRVSNKSLPVPPAKHNKLGPTKKKRLRPLRVRAAEAIEKAAHSDVRGTAIIDAADIRVIRRLCSQQHRKLSRCIRRCSKAVPALEQNGATALQQVRNARLHRQVVMRGCVNERLQKLAEEGPSENSIGCVYRCGAKVRKDTYQVDQELQKERRAKSMSFAPVQLIYSGLITRKQRRKALANGERDLNVASVRDSMSKAFFDALAAALGTIDLNDTVTENEILFQVLLSLGSDKLSAGVQDMVNVCLMCLKMPLPLYMAWCAHHNLQPTDTVEDLVHQEKMLQKLLLAQEETKKKLKAERIQKRTSRWSFYSQVSSGSELRRKGSVLSGCSLDDGTVGFDVTSEVSQVHNNVPL